MPAIEMAPEPYGGERDARRRAAGRVALEREGVTLTTVAELAELLQRAARGDDRARAALGALAERHGAVGADTLLAIAPPRARGAR